MIFNHAVYYSIKSKDMLLIVSCIPLVWHARLARGQVCHTDKHILTGYHPNTSPTLTVNLDPNNEYRDPYSATLTLRVYHSDYNGGSGAREMMDSVKVNGNTLLMDNDMNDNLLGQGRCYGCTTSIIEAGTYVANSCQFTNAIDAQSVMLQTGDSGILEIKTQTGVSCCGCKDFQLNL